MATLRDIRPVLKSLGLWGFLKRICCQIDEDGIFVWASALAYSWLFSIFPFLILLLSLVPYLPTRITASAQTGLSDFITRMLGKASPSINENIEKVMSQPRRGWLGIGLALSIWVASGGMAMTMAALDRCYEVKKPRPYYKQRTLAIAITIGVAIGALLVIILLPIGAAVGEWLKHAGIISRPLLYAFDAARYVLSICFSMLVLATIYYFGPNIRQRFTIISPGAIFSAVVWVLLDVIFRIYVDRYARYDQTYGTMGGAAILLLFFYIDGLVLLIGAEINSEIDFERLGIPEGATDFTEKEPVAPKLPQMDSEL